MTLLTVMMVAGLLLGGMGLALLGSVKVPLARRLAIDEARVGGLVSLFGFTLIPVILTAGFLTDLVGRQVVLMAGYLFMAGSLVLLARARSYLAALVAVILLSTGWALQINVGNVLTPLAFPGKIAYATNLANVFFGIGAFLTPLAIVVMLRRLSFSTALLLLAGAALAPAVLALAIDFVPLTPAAPAAAAEAPGLGRLLGDKIMWLCGLALFFYGPMEASMAAWATTYLGDQGVPEGRASSVLSGFWLTYMAARLITAFTLPAGYEAWLVVALAVACIAVWSGALLGRGKLLAGALVLAAGLIFGPIFPTLMAILLGHFEATLHGRAVGLLFAIGGIGWTVIPMLIGAYARRTSVQRGFLFAVAAAVGLTAVSLVLAVSR
jgi:MFS family permease